jgi:L,D-transpeptidase catalytic domain
VANVSYLRPGGTTDRAGHRARRLDAASPRAPRGRWIAGGVVLIALAVVIGGGIMLVTSKASLRADTSALASIALPRGGGTIESVSVTTGPHSRSVPAELRGQKIWPKHTLPAHQLVSIDVVVKRPGWIGWLAGSTQNLHLQLMTPVTKLKDHFLTLSSGAPLKLSFRTPVRVISYGTPGHLRRRVFGSPQSEITVPRPSLAGTLYVAAAPRSWETSKSAAVSWFPSGAAAAAVATPAPGSTIQADTPITLTFNKPVSKALGHNRPPVSPTTAGTWHTVSSHTIVFRPEGYGYGLGAKVGVGLPSGVSLVNAQHGGSNWRVPGGSPTRLQQLLAILGYLPLNFKYDNGSGIGRTPQEQLAAAVKPPAGHFDWRYPNVPSALHDFWKPGASGVMTQGALMAFENDHALTTDGVAGPNVWRSLIRAAIDGKKSSFGYSFATVSLAGQRLDLWHNGHTVTTTPVNTGIASRPTDPGTFPVYSHLRVTTMSGTNPDGSHYDDPGIQFVSYFNGGDALHAFTRAQYGFPQSLGCVEMSLAPAGTVWPYTPIGTLVHVA